MSDGDRTRLDHATTDPKGGEARRHLAAGLSVSYCDHDTPPGHVLREHPDGHVEMVHIDMADGGRAPNWAANPNLVKETVKIACGSGAKKLKIIGCAVGVRVGGNGKGRKRRIEAARAFKEMRSV